MSNGKQLLPLEMDTYFISIWSILKSYKNVVNEKVYFSLDLLLVLTEFPRGRSTKWS